MPRIGLWSVFVAFPGHIHLLLHFTRNAFIMTAAGQINDIFPNSRKRRHETSLETSASLGMIRHENRLPAKV